MAKTMELCGKCKAAMEKSYELTPIIVGADRKVTCEGCNRRRYSARYRIEKKRGERTALRHYGYYHQSSLSRC